MLTMMTMMQMDGGSDDGSEDDVDDDCDYDDDASDDENGDGDRKHDYGDKCVFTVSHWSVHGIGAGRHHD